MQLRSDLRCKTVAELETRLAAVKEKKGGASIQKRAVVILPELEVYAGLFAHVWVKDYDGKTSILLKDVDSGGDRARPTARSTPLWQKSLEGGPREYEVLKHNLMFCIKRTSGLQVNVEAVLQRANRVLARDDRHQDIAVSARAVAAKLQDHPAILKLRAGKEKQRKGAKGIEGGAATAIAAAAAAAALAAAAADIAAAAAMVAKEQKGKRHELRLQLVAVGKKPLVALSVVALKAHLKALGESLSGKKCVLVERLLGTVFI